MLRGMAKPMGKHFMKRVERIFIKFLLTIDRLYLWARYTYLKSRTILSRFISLSKHLKSTQREEYLVILVTLIKLTNRVIHLRSKVITEK